MAAASDRGSASLPGVRGSKSNPSLSSVRRYSGCPPVPRYSRWTASSSSGPVLSAAASDATSSGCSPLQRYAQPVLHAQQHPLAASSRRWPGPR